MFKNIPIVYDYQSFTVADGQTDYDVKSNVAALFSNEPVATRISIIFDKNISIKFNNTAMESIGLSLADSPFQLPANFMEITNIYVTNASGSIVTMKVLLA